MQTTAFRLPFRLSALLVVLVGLWALQQSKAPRLVATLPHGAQEASFSRDGRQLVTTDGKTACAWDSAGQKLADLVTDRPVDRVRHSSAGHVAALSSEGVTLFAKDLKRIAAVAPPSGVCRAVAFSADSKVMAVGFEGGVLLFDAGTGQKRSQISTAPIQRVEFRKDGKRVVAETAGSTCEVYDGAGQFVKSWYATGLTWSPDGKRSALLRGKKLEVYSGDETLVWSQTLESSGAAFEFGADGKSLLVRPGGREVLVFEASTGKLAGRLSYTGPVRQARLHPKKAWVLAGLASGEVTLREVKSGKPVVEGLKAGSEVTCLAFDAAGKRLAVGEKAGVCSLWEVP